MASDEDLVIQHLSGNERAFARLVERYLPSVYAYAVRFAGQNDAEDIAQETFLKAWKNIERYSSTNARFKTWLMRIARNTSIDYLRKRKSIPFSAFGDAGDSIVDDIPDEAALPEEIASAAYDARSVQQALETLSPAYREVITLYYDGDLTLEETAHILVVPINTVKSRFRRALAALRKELHPKLI